MQSTYCMFQSGSLEATIKDHKAMVTQISSDKVYIYTACSDKLVRCYNKQVMLNFKGLNGKNVTVQMLTPIAMEILPNLF